MGLSTGNIDRWRARFGTTLPDRFGKINAIEHILSHGPQYGIIGGVYFDRIKGRSIMCKDGCGDRRNQAFVDKVRTGAQRGLVQQGWVATWFMRIHRRVFEKIAANESKFPEIKRARPDMPYGFFMPYINGAHSQIGEDSAFCIRASQVGEPSYLDCDIRLFHCGSVWH
jgi:GT2 family glycosyltransferase